MTPRYIVAAAAFLLVAAGAAGAADNAQPPATAPALNTEPFVPEGEKAFYPDFMNVIPGTRIWCQWLSGDIWHYNTTQSVGDGAGMIVYAPAGSEKVGWLCSMDTGIQPEKDKDGNVIHDPLKQYRGICLWIKGDGSDGTAVFSTNWDFSDHQFRVPLKDTGWHKVFMPWGKWSPKPITDYWWYLTYSIERKDASEANWFIVDRVHLFEEEKTEEITPTADVDPTGMIPARQFVSGKDCIGNTLAKLKAGKPVRIVIAGDSIAWGAQLGYVKKNWNYPTSDMRKATYWYLLGQRLRDDYGYKDVCLVLRSTSDGAKTWVDELPDLIKTQEESAQPIARPACALTVVAVAVGGWESGRGLEHIDQILAEKPDLVIWEYGANDSQNGHMAAYMKNTPAAIEKIRAAGSEVALHTLTPCADALPKGWLGNRSLIEANAANNVQYPDSGHRDRLRPGRHGEGVHGAGRPVRRRPLRRLHPPQPPRSRDDGGCA